jgi:hypothetical protein
VQRACGSLHDEPLTRDHRPPPHTHHTSAGASRQRHCAAVVMLLLGFVRRARMRVCATVPGVGGASDTDRCAVRGPQALVSGTERHHVAVLRGHAHALRLPHVRLEPVRLLAWTRRRRRHSLSLGLGLGGGGRRGPLARSPQAWKLPALATVELLHAELSRLPGRGTRPLAPLLPLPLPPAPYVLPPDVAPGAATHVARQGSGGGGGGGATW